MPINYYAPTPTVSGGIVNIDYSSNDNSRTQVYFHQTVDLFKGRLTLTGGYSTTCNLHAGPADALAPSARNMRRMWTKAWINYGIIIKPVPQAAVYFGHTTNSAANAVTSIATGTPPTTDGIQNEGGLRLELLDKRVYATIVYYHIDQTNFGVTNPLNNEFPIPNPQLPALYEDRVAKGWEYELHAAITSELSFIGNGTNFTNRDPNNISPSGERRKRKSWAATLHNQFSRPNPGREGAGRGAELRKLLWAQAGRPGKRPDGHERPHTDQRLSPATHAREPDGGATGLGQSWLKAQVNVDNLFQHPISRSRPVPLRAY